MTKINNFTAKKNQEKITCLTAYTYPVAKAIDPYCDLILVGDSLGMTIYGLKDTVDVSLGMMIDHGLAVSKACTKSLVAIDIPANTFEKSAEQALKTAQEIYSKTGCDAVKIETGPNQIAAIELISQNNIPIISHVGLLPQNVRELGGYSYQGQDENSAAQILDLAIKSEQAGAFSVVIEAVPTSLADQITSSLSIPTIGIGASKNCDGQILVIDDLIGLNQEFTPKFVKKYGQAANYISQCAKSFSEDVKSGSFPDKSNLLEK